MVDQSLYGFVKDWQTLLAGSLAIGAAMLGGRFVNRQTTQYAKFEKDRTNREFRAARAMMPLALSSIVNYCREVARKLDRLHGLFLNGVPGRDYVIDEFPLPPFDAIDLLRRVVESAPNDTIADLVSELISMLQVASSRFAKLHQPEERGLIVQIVIEDYILFVAEIFARSSDMFEFARREMESIPEYPAIDSTNSALNLLNCRGDAYDQMRDTALRRWRTKLLKSHPRSKRAQEMLSTWIDEDPNAVLEKFAIEQSDDFYLYRSYRYDQLEHAVNYAILDQARSDGNRNLLLI